MSTNSSISIKVGNKIKTIYSHWDGYPSNNGKILLDSYKTKGKVEKLIALGNISSLAKRHKPNKVGYTQKRDSDNFRMYDKNHNPILVRTTKAHTFDTPHAETVVAYERDRGETDQEPRIYTDKIREVYEYNYMFENGKWFISEDCKNWALLTKRVCDVI